MAELPTGFKAVWREVATEDNRDLVEIAASIEHKDQRLHMAKETLQDESKHQAQFKYVFKEVMLLRTEKQDLKTENESLKTAAAEAQSKIAALESRLKDAEKN